MRDSTRTVTTLTYSYNSDAEDSYEVFLMK